jgi:hypothetical protein
VRPTTGEVRWLISPKANVEIFSLPLKHFARGVRASREKRILLVLGQVGWYTGKEVEVPEGIPFEFLPGHSPELQLPERSWPLTNEAISNRLFDSLNEFEVGPVGRCVALCAQQELI